VGAPSAQAILARMTRVFECEVRNVLKHWAILACCLTAVVTAVELNAQSQPPSTPASGQPVAQGTAPSPPQNAALDNSRRIEILERDMILIKYSMEIVRDVAIALGGFATMGLVIFGYLSWRRETKVQENYRRERKYFEEGQRLDRDNYARERSFYEFQAARRADHETKMAAQQLEMGALGLTRFDSMLANQSKNIEALGHVLEVIARASDIRLKREEGHEQFEAMMKSLRTGAERRYVQARDEAERLKDVKAAQWPMLPLDRRQVAIGALRAYQSVDDFVKEEHRKNENETGRHASLLQRLGVFAYYADHDYEGAIAYLGESIRLFSERPVDDQFRLAQAWAQHFLGVLKKNWPLSDETPGTSLLQAQELLAEAERHLTMELGQFLTPLTHAEVLSYIRGQQQAADSKAATIVRLLEERRSRGEADKIQMSILPRAYLLRGNIALMLGDRQASCAFFAKSSEVSDLSPYPWLSLAEATVDVDVAKAHWEKGLSLLPKPPATDKPETSTRVLVFAWGILASHAVGDSRSQGTYQTAFDEIGSVIEKDGKYTPLFFSPISKTLVSFDELGQQLKRRTGDAPPKQ
jgi:hypothetical protein